MALLGSDVIDRQLSLKQRIAVFVHLRHCKNCRLYCGFHAIRTL
ncbi:zf-HC2 domain-containing protein, partial [Pseudomonas aeruginosa]